MKCREKVWKFENLWLYCHLQKIYFSVQGKRLNFQKKKNLYVEVSTSSLGVAAERINCLRKDGWQHGELTVKGKMDGGMSCNSTFFAAVFQSSGK